jgi:Gas vesicle protein
MPIDPIRDEHALDRRLDEVRPSLDGEVALVDLLDRLLAGGVVLTGNITLAIADVDLVHISLRALFTSIEADLPAHGTPERVRASATRGAGTEDHP